MARIPYFDLEHAPAEYAALLDVRKPLNLYRMLPHAGVGAASGFLRMGGALLRENELDSRLREIVILRVGMLSDAGYEVHQHKRVARSVGLSEEKIEAIAQGADAPVFDELERLILRFTDTVVRDVKAPDALFNAVLERLDHRRMAELVFTIGFYMMVSRFLENFEVDIEPPGAF
ncbi:carboxymuconolactone decarboxylase family protein [Verticiella sediminum]|uniref:Carboxymuconolactone decarboxylase family protein n=1 Tax=Verticiella sediminum TaxID=1247510 RepID=A0A556B115_9BURK|nr:carboxymuconolactone decarboxylase family protein [Verticiella sediminum]TSH98860.1 carboxymuconolactone decarboxylase family protein [Verticiella sediminum]